MNKDIPPDNHHPVSSGATEEIHKKAGQFMAGVHLSNTGPTPSTYEDQDILAFAGTMEFNELPPFYNLSFFSVGEGGVSVSMKPTYYGAWTNYQAPTTRVRAIWLPIEAD